MRWRKFGRIFTADHQHPWMATHAANPTAQVAGPGLVRVFFSTRDDRNRSHVAAAMLELGPNPRIIDVSSQPVLSPGETGLFDDSGTSMGCVVETPGAVHLYYLGWNLGVTVPWRNSIGLAVSRDGGKSFAKFSRAPLLDRSEADPFSLSYPWVLAGADGWRMWYGSNLRWGTDQRDMDHVIKHATSRDGIHWERSGQVVLPLRDAAEYALARPSVLPSAHGFDMWFTHRGAAYRIGRARSRDGLSWERGEDELAFDRPAEPWESGMTTYPCVFDCDGSRYLLYNGNDYGRTGFGLAVLDA